MDNNSVIIMHNAKKGFSSVVNKYFILHDFKTSHDLDISFVTETWLIVNDPSPFTKLVL